MNAVGWGTLITTLHTFYFHCNTKRRVLFSSPFLDENDQDYLQLERGGPRV